MIHRSPLLALIAVLTAFGSLAGSVNAQGTPTAQTIPANLVAGIFGFHDRPFFEVEEPVREAPQVRF